MNPTGPPIVNPTGSPIVNPTGRPKIPMRDLVDTESVNST